ncbi:shikimate dehydrogenase [Wenzhouxiangella sp. AB-CW3]|uniref:shikimate dehydrogenase n=1 Tax=Wenzhouxiangella sp. AB-CW3 TaxID=2771012 RepID=UPI00168AACC8|nr:shikimate dehydrogenase [Wenzhouxiangella sp. AB-CW3]QOC22338.1 shikimate dehydrogenase [Wenzhouxiangella sp. AB-CW3]
MQSAHPIKLAVFGQPISHSLSPRIHEMFGNQLGIPVDYQAIESSPEQLPERLIEFRDSGGMGANLTLPLKETGLELCEYVDIGARYAGAVNTLKAIKSGWHGYNTDGAGMMLDLDRLGLQVNGRNVLLIGAGGAAAGLLEPLLAAGPNLLCILNRTPERASTLVDRFAHRGNLSAGGLEEGPDLTGFDLLIQSTSAGHNQDGLTLRRDWLNDNARAYDLNYGRAHTGFNQWCQNNELPVHDGLGMLVGQAALAFEIWTGKRPEIQPVLTSIRGVV